MEVPISQDIRKYKTKDIGNFSFKEAGFIAAGCGAAFVTYKMSGSIEAAVLPMALVLVVGFLKPFGMTFLQFLRTVVKEQFTPRTYIWETDFEYEADEFESLYGEKIREQSEWNVPLADTSKFKISKQDKPYIIQ